MKYKVSDDLKLIIDDVELSVAEIATDIGVSKTTIFSILENRQEPDDETIEKIYSYFYKMGYMLNHAKEELYKENNKMILFHGSRFGLEKITYNGSRSNCDLGNGFYLGETFKQTASFVYEFNTSSVYVFKADFADLKVKEFECDLSWMLAICYFRGTINKYSSHPMIKKIIDEISNVDVIIAPIADNRMFYIMQLFADGELTTKQAMYSLSASSLGKQYVLKTESAIDRLKMLERLYICQEERAKLQLDLINRGEEIDTKIKMAKRMFKGEGQFIDELFV